MATSCRPHHRSRDKASVDVYNAQEKLWGLLGANDTTTADGNAIFNTDIPLQQLAGVALHELIRVLGRTPVISMIDTKVPNVFDLFRFTSPGVRLFQSSWDNSHPAPAAYFSVDGGFTRAADYGQFTTPATSSTEACKGRTIRSTNF